MLVLDPEVHGVTLAARRSGQRRRGRASSGQGDCQAGRKNSVPYSCTKAPGWRIGPRPQQGSRSCSPDRLFSSSLTGTLAAEEFEYVSSQPQTRQDAL